MEKILKYIIWAGLLGICFIPLLVRSNYFFPFIVPKTVAFGIIIEVIFLAFLGLAVIKKEYRPKLNLVLALFFLYITTVFLSSILAGSFYFSFWSNNERSEGLLLLLHLFLFLVVLTGFLRRLKDWLIVFEAFFISGLLVCLVALGQYLNLSWLLGSSGGIRLASTIGNAGYVAGYLIFNIFFGLFLFFFRKNRYLRLYYVLGILLQIFIVLNTLSRGGILALAFSLTVFVGYLVFFYLKSNKLVRNTGIIILLLIVFLAGLVFFNKQADWVKDNPVLDRISTISVSATTAQNRLMTWQSAYQGFKEKPMLGYGYENFYQVFDKYFNPKIYRHAGSVVWFDRAHNIIFDRLITGGLVGLFMYLILLFLPLYYLWRWFYRNKIASAYLIPVIFTLVALAYFIQNLFIFEALVTYIPLFLILGFLSQFNPSWQGKLSQSKKPYLVLLTIGVIVFLPILFMVSIKPAAANKELIKAMIKAQTGKYQEAYGQFVEVLERGAFNNQEYRERFSEFVIRAIDIQEVDEDWKRTAALKAEQEFDKQIEEKPKQTRNYLMFMRFLNRTYHFNPERLNKSLALAEKAIKLSPTRPQTYYEVAYTQVYLGKYYQFSGQTEKAQEFFDQSIINAQKAIDLNDRVIESYVNMVMILLTVEQSEQVQFYLDKMDEMGINYHTENSLNKIASSAIYAKNYQSALDFYKELTKNFPNNSDHWLNLALSYAYLGQKEKAVETAEIVKEFGEKYIEQADLFIQEVLSGNFD
ncbi:MAG: O-antigen ligase family protein [Candidatus Portnoybacteria bacterium]|nr:O-antigen ligase family protein [Candidatus Portnoybacteria bacterium]